MSRRPFLEGLAPYGGGLHEVCFGPGPVVIHTPEAHMPFEEGVDAGSYVKFLERARISARLHDPALSIDERTRWAGKLVGLGDSQEQVEDALQKAVASNG